MSATLIDRLLRRAQPTKRDLAALEARRAWEVVRTGVAERADTIADLAGDQFADARDATAHQLVEARKVTGRQLSEARKVTAKQLSEARKATAHQLADARDAAAPRVEQLRGAAAPQVRHLRSRAVDIIDPVAEKVREELSDLTATAGRELSRVAVDIRDATRGEADRVIQALHDSSEAARVEDRRGRVRALVGWALFGLLAGGLLAREYEQRRVVTDVIAPVPTGASIPPAPVVDGSTEDDRADVPPITP